MGAYTDSGERVLLNASENHIGEVGGKSDIFNPDALVVTAGAYHANDVIGGLLTLSNAVRVSGGTALLQSLFVLDAANQKAAMEILVFNSNPSASTFTDNAAPVIHADDRAKIIRRISVLASDYVTIGGLAIADISPGSRVVKAAGSRNLYMVITTPGTPTYVATSDLSVSVGMLED